MSNYTPVLSSVKLPSGKVYYFKDNDAREQIESIINYDGYLGVTTTTITDQCTTNPVEIEGEMVTAKSGDIVIYGPREFIFSVIDIDGVKVEVWKELGYISSLLDLLGKMAYNDTGRVVIRPKGNISAQTFSGIEGTIDIEFTPTGRIEAIFTGSSKSIYVTGVPQGMIQIAEIIASVDGNYTPSGTIRNNVNINKTNININNIISTGTLPSFTVNTSNGGILNAGVMPNNEELSLYYDSSMISWSAGTLPTISETAVLDDVSVSIDSEFIGTTVQISPEFIGSSTTFVGEYTPEGQISATFIGSSTILSSTYTPSGSISQAEFEGISEEHIVYPIIDPKESQENINNGGE